MKKVILVLSSVLFISISLLSVENKEIRVNKALAGGTCCGQEFARCYPNNCSSSLCAVANSYWHDKGTKCPESIASDNI